jgi:hypothetical protein
MASVGNLSVSLGLDSAQFIAGLKRAAAQTQATGAQISKFLSGAKAIGGTLAAAFSVDWIRGQIQSAFDYADAIQDLADRTGATTKFIQEFRYAAQLSGSSVEGADAAVEKFSENLGSAASGNQAMLKQMKDLGVTSTDVDTAIKQAADGIAKLPTKAQQAAASVSLFGKSAQELTQLLSQGSSGINDLARAADDLGIVLDDRLIANAGQVNDKLDAMSMIVTAQFANVIIQNADAIAGLADAIAKVVTQLIQFWAQNPKTAMTIMGGLAGAAGGFMVAGPWGAVAGGIGGAAGGYYMGSKMEQSMKDNSGDLKVRLAEFRKARAAYKDAKAGKGGQYLPDMSGMGGMGTYIPPDVKAAGAEFVRQGNLLKQATARQEAANAARNAPKGGGTGGGTLPGLKPTGGSKKTTPEDHSAEYRQRALRQFQDAMSDAEIDFLSAKRDLSPEVVDQSALEREMLEIRKQRELRRIDDDTGSDKEIAEGKKRYTEAQANELKAKLEAINYQEADLINHRENEALAKEALEVRRAGLQNDVDLLQGDLALARGRTEKADIQKRIIRNQAEQERLELEAVIASKDSTDAQKKIAQARLDLLDRITKQQTDAVDKGNKSPLGQFLDDIPSTAEEINDALENVEVNGLQSLQDGLANAITGVGSLGDAFKSMTSTVINGLIQIALQQAIIKPLGNALFGGGDGGLGGIFGGLFGKRANGGLTRPGRYLMGERGPEIVDVGNTANVVNTRQLGVANDNGGGINVSFGPITSNDPAMVKALALQAMAEAAPVFRKQGTDATLAKIKRPSL